jgi:hypothetical protein
VINKGINLNALEKFYICKVTKQGIQLNDMYTDVNTVTLFFEDLIKKQ